MAWLPSCSQPPGGLPLALAAPLACACWQLLLFLPASLAALSAFPTRLRSHPKHFPLGTAKRSELTALNVLSAGPGSLARDQLKLVVWSQEESTASF